MNELLTRKEAAERLGVSLVTLDEERAAGRIGYIQRAPGCKVYFRQSDLETWLARNTHQPIPVQVLSRTTYRRRRA